MLWHVPCPPPSTYQRALVPVRFSHEETVLLFAAEMFTREKPAVRHPSPMLNPESLYTHTQVPLQYDALPARAAVGAATPSKPTVSPTAASSDAAFLFTSVSFSFGRTLCLPLRRKYLCLDEKSIHSSAYETAYMIIIHVLGRRVNGNGLRAQFHRPRDPTTVPLKTITPHLVPRASGQKSPNWDGTQQHSACDSPAQEAAAV